MVSAKELAEAGYKYIGASYEDMDCQEFIEKCLQDCGLKKDLKGSNAWYRAMTWTGTPEECTAIFGLVPVSAFLFIVLDDGGEKARGYTDGRGNASHIGMSTGKGKGAIHSSETRGCVAESTFNGRTVKNCGWNAVGLTDLVDYGQDVNQMLARLKDEPKEDKRMAVVFSSNGKPVNLRKEPDGALVDRIACGTKVTVRSASAGWAKVVTQDGKSGYMMEIFLQDDDHESDGDMVSIAITRDQAEALLKVSDIVAGVIGRG